MVDFSNSAGTITRTDGQSWSSLGYTVGEGIYIQGTGTNGNGATFNPNGNSGYYTISAINGDVITLQGGQSLTVGSDQTVNIAPVTTNVPVTFGNAGNAGTITLDNDQTWASLGYTVGQEIFVGSSTDANANGTSFNASASKSLLHDRRDQWECGHLAGRSDLDRRSQRDGQSRGGCD